MKKTNQKNNVFYPVATIVISFVIVKIINKFTGFHYDIAEGIFNINFLIDFALWLIVYIIVAYILEKSKWTN